mgnify:CR=1 FL=1
MYTRQYTSHQRKIGQKYQEEKVKSVKCQFLFKNINNWPGYWKTDLRQCCREYQLLVKIIENVNFEISLSIFGQNSMSINFGTLLTMKWSENCHAILTWRDGSNGTVRSLGFRCRIQKWHILKLNFRQKYQFSKYWTWFPLKRSYMDRMAYIFW